MSQFAPTMAEFNELRERVERIETHLRQLGWEVPDEPAPPPAEGNCPRCSGKGYTLETSDAPYVASEIRQYKCIWCDGTGKAQSAKTPPAEGGTGEAWTAEVPTKTGWYWWRLNKSGEYLRPKHLREDGMAHGADYRYGQIDFGGEWWPVPIPHPAEPVTPVPDDA